MIKTTTFVFTFFSIITLLAQPTITSNDFMTANDTARISITSDNSIDFTTTGNNQVWDFSYLQAESQRIEFAHDITQAGFLVNIQFGPNASAEYVSDYYKKFEGLPLDLVEDFLPVNIEDISRVSKIEDDSLTNTGYIITAEGNEVGFKSDTIESLYKFPMNYQDSFTSRSYTHIDFNPMFDGTFIQYRQIESIVDGHGTLITPYDTFNTLRVHHVIEEQDSLYAEMSGTGTWIPIERTMHSYEWWTNGEKRPVLQIQTEEVNNTETVTDITYRDKYLGLDASLNNEKIDVSLYPNPAEENVAIMTSKNIKSVSVFSNTGQKVMDKQDISANQTSLSLKEITSGIYFVKTSTVDGTNVSKLVVK
ncbi:MAG: T9SS type A sorting domain-containing protein [Brumimicrobium sp.]